MQRSSQPYTRRSAIIVRPPLVASVNASPLSLLRLHTAAVHILILSAQSMFLGHVAVRLMTF
jgi:hypothetical protein